MAKNIPLLVCLVWGLAASGAIAAERERSDLPPDPSEGGCTYNREIHHDGDEVCQGETRKRCVDGKWTNLGRCEQPVLEPPRADGGDQVRPAPPRPPDPLEPKHK
jgi:hypothetical protein